MKRLSKPRHIISGGVAFALLLGVLASVFYFQGAAIHASSPKAVVPHQIKVHPQYMRTNKINSADPNIIFSCQTPGAPVRCYGPFQMHRAYDIQRVLDSGDRGQGSTIVIIDAFQSPTIRQDLRLFDNVFRLQPATLNIIAPDGLTPFDPNDPNQVGWSGEISLDVEWAHAISPAATIDLVLAKSNMDADILSVTKFAVDHNLGDVISQSFGEGEMCMDPGLLAQQHQIFQQAVNKGITLFASSGDEGAAQPTCDGSSFFLSASTPASDPFVTAVGGTYLNANPKSGMYHGESAWNDQFGATGGGYSTIYSRPGYQSGFVSRPQRGVPDVAYDGDVNGGVLVAWGVPFGVGAFFIFGGTSAGSPQWAGMLALVNTDFGRQGNINPILYKGFARHGDGEFFHDILVGTNTFTGAGSNGKVVTIRGYNTNESWDAVTGLGTLILGNTFFGPPATPAFWPKH